MRTKTSITLQRLIEVLLYDALSGVFVWVTTCSNAATKGSIAGTTLTGQNGGYISIQIDGKPYLAHRLAWLWVYGEWPKFIDHINGNRSDNRIHNLRNVSHSTNMKNKVIPKNNTSGVVGVTKVTLVNKKGSFIKWHAAIRVNGKIHSLGNHDTIEEAANARKVAELKHGFHKEHGKQKEICYGN